MGKPVIALTMGDAAGIGPEVVARVLSQPWSRTVCRPFVIGDGAVLRQACRLAGSVLEVVAISRPAEARFRTHAIEVLTPSDLTLPDFRPGVLSPELGRAAALCLAAAFDLALGGEVDGVVSAPLNKAALQLAGFHYRDELQYIADRTGSPAPYTIGVIGPDLWTISVTEHVPLSAVPGAITRPAVLECIHRLHEALVRAGQPDPRLAVAALNPHAGEGGHLGREEVDAIEPAVDQARGEGIHVLGPCPADTVFVRAREGEFHGVVCLYHDQANIARKLLATRRGATLFMGLPAVCGTTAHGTAYDVAGQGVADPGSLRDALRYTCRLARTEPIT